MKFVAYMVVSFITFFHIVFSILCIIVHMVVCFGLILYKLCILIVMYTYCYVYVPFYQNYHLCYNCYWYFINSYLLKQIY